MPTASTPLREALRRLAESVASLAAATGGREDLADEARERLREFEAAFEADETRRERLRSVSRRVNAGLTLDEVLDLVFTSFDTVIPFDRIGCALVEEEGKVARARWARARDSEIHLDRGYSAPLDDGSLKEILRTGRPRILNDLEAYLGDHPQSESTRLIVAEGMRSSLTCPLLAGGRAVGFLFFSSRETGTYATAHTDAFEAIAEQVSFAVEKGRVYQDLKDLDALRSRFLGMAAHDLRRPIAVVKGFASLIKEGILGPLTEAQKDAVERVEAAAQSMIPLIEDVLDISAIESGALRLEPVEIPPAEFLRDCCEAERVLAQRKSIRIETDIADARRPLRFDPKRIRQVMGNLLDNAIKYSPVDTTIVVRARRDDAGLTVAVADEGPGIEADQTNRLFQPFATTPVRPTGGEKSLGLGLAIVKRVVEAHGGRVRAENRPEKGATFSFFLPGEGPDAEADRERDFSRAPDRITPDGGGA